VQVIANLKKKYVSNWDRKENLKHPPDNNKA